MEEVKSFDFNSLSRKDKEFYDFVKSRITELQESRKNHLGTKIESIWAEADKDYVPRRLRSKGKRVIVEDETKGWRGNLVELGSSDWQSDVAKANVFTKIQAALSILIDQNPAGVFTPLAKKFQATTELMRQLYQRSWEYAKSKGQLQLFVFNLAKYGWAIARTYPLKIKRKVRVLTDYNDEEPEKSVWEEKEIIEFNDIFRKNLDPWNAWIDDMTTPNNNFSMRDWAWREIYSKEVFDEQFGNYPNAKYVKVGGNTQTKITGSKTEGTDYQSKDLVEVYFYENKIKDLFMVIANDVPVLIEPLPIADAKGVKKLSCWQTYWNLRDAQSPYGIGIYEAIRYDKALLDRIRNMTIDQLVLSIYKMFFYQGTQSLSETGDVKITPGVGKQVLDPKNINWLQVPGPGNEAWTGLQLLEDDVDEASGIPKSLTGEITGKTAFEIAQVKEAALKRLKTPLNNITEALNTEAYITLALIQLLYSIPETYQITDPELIDEYLKETKADPALYERGQNEEFIAKVYPEFPLNLEENEKGDLTETEATRFFRLNPNYLCWEGIISVKSQSVLSPSKQIDKSLELEMYNMLIPLFQLPPQLYAKTAKAIVKLYDKDPRDILPDLWLQAQVPIEEQPLIVDQEPLPVEQEMGGGTPQAQKLTTTPQAPTNGQGMVAKIMGKLRGKTM